MTVARCPAFAPNQTAAGPIVDGICDLHRGPDGLVSFSRKTAAEGWEPLGAVSITRVRDQFPEFREEVQRDAYFSLNSAHPNATFRATRPLEAWEPTTEYGPEETVLLEGQKITVRKETRYRTHSAIGLRYAGTSQADLRWLNACYVDLDCTRIGVDLWSAYAGIGRAQDAGVIPPVSMLARSGRGWWLFWLLVDERNPADGEAQINGARHTARTPQRAWPEKISEQTSVNRHTGRRLTGIPGGCQSGGRSRGCAGSPGCRPRGFRRDRHEDCCADIVVLDRVVCCYPAWSPLLAAAMSRGRVLLGLTYPRARADG